MAIELGDWRSVPRYRALPGPLVQALAFETIAQGRALYPVRGWPAAASAALLIRQPGRLRQPARRRALLLLGGSVLAIAGLATGLQLLGAVALDTSVLV